MRSHLVALLFLSSAAPLIAADLEDDFVELYSKHQAKLAAFYTNMQMDFIYETHFQGGGEERKSRTQCVYKAAAPRYLLELHEKKHGTTVLGVNAEAGFRLKKSAAMQKFFLDRLTPDKQEWTTRIKSSTNAPFAPFCVLNPVELVTAYIEFDTITLTKKSDILEKGKKLIRFDFNYVIPQRPEPPWPGSLTFDPSAAWVLVSWQSSHPGGVERTTITYDEMVGEDDIPLVKDVRYTLKDDTGTLTKHWKIVDIRPGPVDDEEFSLEHYGVKRPRQAGTNYLIRILNIALIIAVILFILFRILAAYTQRKGKHDGEKGQGNKG